MTPATASERPVHERRAATLRQLLDEFVQGVIQPLRRDPETMAMLLDKHADVVVRSLELAQKGYMELDGLEKGR